MKLALRIEVSTYRGTLNAVPRLVDMLQRQDARATFLFTLGRDRTGKLLRRAERARDVPHEISRRIRYGRHTRLYGTLLPAPDVGRRAGKILRSVHQKGFEVGIRVFDEVEWLHCLQRPEEGPTRHALTRAVSRFRQVFGDVPLVHGAPGWQSSRYAIRLEQRLDFAFASDTRGTHPFMPVQNGELVLCPQVPTTLPTAEELIRQRRARAGTVASVVLDHSRPGSGRNHVYSLHAELEGDSLAPAFAATLEGWRQLGYRVCALGDLLEQADLETLPRHELTVDNVPGRAQPVLMQGEEFPGDWARPGRLPGYPED